ncbi:MAG: Gfo/Idh/MocA family oxidoreductase [bacterium]
MNHPLHAAVIGCGVVGPWHMRCVNLSEQAELVVCCDVDEEKGRKAAEEFGCVWERDYENVLTREDIDVVHICTPSGMHSDMGVAAAHAKKHVLCEKPIDIQLSKIDALISACDEERVALGCIFQARTMPAIEHLKEAVDKGWLGNLILGEMHQKWYRKQEYYDSRDWLGTWDLDGGGALMNQGTHAVDLLQYIMGPIDSVFAHVGTLAHTIDVEDTAVAAVKFANGAMGTIVTTTSVWPGQNRLFEVHGTKGTVAIEYDSISQWKLMDGPEEPPSDVRQDSGRQATASDPAGLERKWHFLQIEDFYTGLRTNRAPLVTGQEARKAVEIILAIYRSARTGEPVSLPLVD